jgi:hypothetical protein
VTALESNFRLAAEQNVTSSLLRQSDAPPQIQKPGIAV